jgi:hypothetical protein
MRCRSERPAPLEALRAIVEQLGTPIRSGAGRVLRHPSSLFPARFSSMTKQVSICAKGPAPAALNPFTYKGTSGESGAALLRVARTRPCVTGNLVSVRSDNGQLGPGVH